MELHQPKELARRDSRRLSFGCQAAEVSKRSVGFLKNGVFALDCSYFRSFEAAPYFRDLWRLREARSALLMISPSLLPKAAMSIGAGLPLIESERSGYPVSLLVVGSAMFVIIFLTHGTDPCAGVIDNIR
jgi:hypothetical protein